MANELTLTAAMSYLDAVGGADSLTLPAGFQATVGTLIYVKKKALIGTSNTALDLGSIGTLGFFMAINRDANNNISIVSASAGIIIATMFPGEPCGPFRFGSGVTAPYAIALNTPSYLEYLLISA